MLDERHTAPTYHVYLLRLWQEDAGECRAVLQETQSGEKRGFADVEALIDHLRQIAANEKKRQ